jgi:cysteine desulfurase/selenocysteine lyase
MLTETKHIAFDIHKIRSNFPLLSQEVNGNPLIYFDNAATTQKPKQVIDAIVKYYSQQNANVHRGVHHLSQDTTLEYENARGTVQRFIHAKHSHEIIFTRGTTESINLVASCLGKHLSPKGEGLGVRRGDEILITEMEHHSNILPWQQLCEGKNALLKVIPINEKGELLLDEFEKLLSKKTKLVAITHVSNTLGTINPVKEIISIVRNSPLFRRGGGGEVAILVDGAQAIPHLRVDVQELDADFYCFSGHKVYAPTGIGILYGKEKWLNRLPNYQVGGGTIKTVSFEKTEYAEQPLRFEAGTPNIEGALGLATALNYINSIGLENISEYEQELLEYATEKISAVEGLRIIGTSKNKVGIISFVVDKIHHYDAGVILDQLGIAVRTGHHCTQPIMDKYGIAGTVRASFSFYNTKEEIDEFIKGIQKVKSMLK